MAHLWKFFRAGGFDQVRLDTGADLAHLDELDPKLWVALACPTKGLELDAHTLSLLDTDQDGRVRVPEVIAAAKWTTALLKNPDALHRGDRELALDAIDTGTEEGRQVLASARQLLENLGKPNQLTLSPDDVGDTVKIFSKTLFNGDGVIPAEAANDEPLRQALRDIIGSVGSIKDLSGLDGLDQPRLDKFFTEAAAFLEWSKKGDGAISPAAYDAFMAVKPKVEDYFARCALAAMDGASTAALNPSAAQYAALSAADLSPSSPAARLLPLARVEASRPLPLHEGVNPGWEASLSAFSQACVKPLLGEKTALTASEWITLSGKLAAQEAWHAIKPVGTVEKLGAARLAELTAGPTKLAIDALMARDKLLEPQLKAITSVDRLVHFHRDLATFVNNFVAFRDFYTHRAKALFQAGTLYLDGRSCELCLRVEDPARHGALAGLSMAYLAYCELTRKGSPEKLTIVAAFTGGDSDFLMVGRNGVFYDRKGQDWDATITKVVEQPISVRQAFWSPYKRIAKFVEDQINGFASAKEKESHEGLTAGATDKLKKAEPTAFDVAKFAGVFAALGLAVGMIGSAVAAILTGFLGLKVWQMPLALGGAMLVVSGPSMLLAAMKLRKRNLGPLLDASGWAINARAKINIPFGGSLTHLAQLPAGSQLSRSDPYAAKKSRLPAYASFVALLALAYWLWTANFFAPWVDKLLAK